MLLSALTWRKQGQHRRETLLPRLLALILIGAHARPSYSGTPSPLIRQPCGLLHCTDHIVHTNAYPASSAGHWALFVYGKKWEMLIPTQGSVPPICFTADTVLVTLQRVSPHARTSVAVAFFPSAPPPKSALHSCHSEPTWPLDGTYPSIPLGLCSCCFLFQEHLASPSSSYLSFKTHLKCYLSADLYQVTQSDSPLVLSF